MRTLNLQSFRYSRVAGFALQGLAATALLGWLLRSSVLTTWGGGPATTAPLTAFCLLVAGLGLIVEHPEQDRRSDICGASIAIAGALGLTQGLIQLDGGIGTSAAPAVGGASQLLYSEATALSFVFAGLALVVRRRYAIAARMLGCLVALVGLLALLDYAATMGDRHLPGFVAVALPTAVGFLILGSGLVADVAGDRVELPLKVVLGALVIGSLLPAFVFMVAQSRSLSEQRLEAIRIAGANAADDVAALVSVRLGERIALLRGLATSPALTSPGAEGVLSPAARAAFHAQARAAIGPADGWIILTDANGDQLVNSRRELGENDLIRLELPTIAKSLQTGQPQISDLHTSATRGAIHLFSISYPVAGGALVLNWRIPVEEFSDALRRIGPEGWIYAIADRQGRIIARNRNGEQWIGKPVTPSAWSKSRASPTGWDRTFTLEGTPAFTSWQQLPSGWTVLIGVGERSIDVAGRAQTRRLTIGAMLMTVLGLLFATLGAILISRPLLRFSAIGETGANASHAMPAPRTVVREINALATALTNAARDRQRVTMALAVSEARLRRFVDQAPAAIAMFDQDMRYLAASQRWQLYFSPRVKDLAGRLHYEVFPDITPEWKQYHQRGLAGEVLHADNDSFIRPDGTQQFVRWELRPWRTVEGNIGGIIIFADDVSERSVAEMALRESEARLKAIVDTATDAIVVINADGIVESFNAAAEKMFGYESSEVVGGNVSMLMAGRERAQHDDYLKSYHLTGMAKMIGIGREVTGRRKDATSIPIDLSIAQWTVGGRRHYTGIMRDITSRKERENHLRLVMRELSHRTKNALAVVQAMAWQTSRTTKNAAEFQQQFTQRVDGLSRSIGLLVRSEWEGVDVQDLVRGQLAPFLDDAVARLQCQGPPLVLKPNAAQDLGLVLHELATNASKYGALSVATGHVRAAWEIQPDNDGRKTFRFHWQEMDGPTVSLPTRAGFGSSLIKDMLAKTYKASVTMEFEPSGLRWRFEMDADRIITYDGPGPIEPDSVVTGIS